MWDFLRILNTCVLPLFAFAAPFLWRLGTRSRPGRPVADRIAWSLFALGIGLMFTMALYSMASESDGDFRSWETVRLHGRVFLAFAAIAVSGPLLVFLRQSVKTHPSGSSGKKPPPDDLA